MSVTCALLRRSAKECPIDRLIDGSLRSLSSEQVLYLAGTWLLSSLRVRVAKRKTRPTSLAPVADRLKKLKTLHIDRRDVVNVESVSHILPGVTFESLRGLRDVKLDSAHIHSLGQLVHCHALKKLSLGRCAYLYDISALVSLPLLEDLNISSLRQVSDFQFLEQLSELSVLDASDCNIVNANVFIKNRKLSSLKLSDCTMLDCITALSDLPCLELLNTDNTSVVKLPSLPAIRSLNLHRSAISDISALAGSSSITSLDISWCVNIDDAALLALRDCDNLAVLDISRTTIKSIASLSEIANLYKLLCNFCPLLEDISPLVSCSRLGHLELKECSSLHDIQSVQDCENLFEIDISGSPAEKYSDSIKQLLPDLLVLTNN